MELLLYFEGWITPYWLSNNKAWMPETLWYAANAMHMQIQNEGDIDA